jgi:anti-anti-sigma factor
MEIHAERVEGAMVVAVSGSVDTLTAGEVSDSIANQIDNGYNRVVLDMSGVDFMSSAGLRAILSVLKQSRQLGGDLYIAAARPGVDKVLNISGFTSILKAFPSVDLALAEFTS